MSKPVFYFDDASPPARSVLMLIEILKIDLEYKFIDLFTGEQLKEEFLKINPIHTVPTLVDGDLILTDSHSIMIYLCEKYEKSQETVENADNALWPTNLKERMEVLNKIFFACSFFFRRDSDLISDIIRKGYDNIEIAQHEKKVLECYDILDIYLSNQKFVAGDELTLADVTTVCILSTVNMIFPLSKSDENKWSSLKKWFEYMKNLPSYHLNEKGLARLRAKIELLGKFKIPASQNDDSCKLKNFFLP